MEKFHKYDIKPIIDEKNEQHAIFTISPLEKGMGLTLGNALRRTLLFDIPGSSLFAIKIKGVTHEFQAIDGVKEDVTQIILNLKGVVISIDEAAYSDEELASTAIEHWKVMKLNVEGKKVVHAKDITLPSGFKIINEDVYICELTDEKSKLEMDLYATRGRGFTPFTVNNEKIGNSLSLIATDSDFSPIIRVGYAIDEVKVSKYETGDKLTLDVSTNGSITPSDAVALAAKVLSDHLSPLIAINESIREYNMMQEEAAVQKNRTLSTSIESMNLSVRSYNCLKRVGIHTIEDLTSKTRSEVEHIKNLGRKSLKEIQKRIAEQGLSFKEEEYDSTEDTEK